jgi:uncharacterized membrane protein
MSMSNTAEAMVLAVFILATSVWVGGYVAIAAVARAATATLDRAARVAFFRALGRLYFWVGVPALIVAVATGGLLARDVATDGLFVALVALLVALLVGIAVAVAQARRMTRLRQSLLTSPSDESLRAQVARGGQAAGILRAVLGLLSIASVVLGSFIAV